MADDDGDTRNTIEGGIQYGPVLQGRDFINPTFVTHQAAAAPVARVQLPAVVSGFTGRELELGQLAGLLDPAGETTAVLVSAVAGLAGVGKTALVIQAGHAAREAGWFRGGVLFLDLHGYDDRMVQAGQALESLLRALGVPGEHIPPGMEDRAGLYRSVLAQVTKPILVIADNASSEAQVRLLLPGPGPHRMVVTSRHILAGLGARLVDVTILDEAAGVVLLDTALRAARPADDRITADREAAVRLAGMCGGLPLALRIAGALLIADHTLSAEELADELGDEIHRLEALRYDDGGGTRAPSVAAAFELSYRQLDSETARLFRLLPANPGPDISAAAVAALAGQPAVKTRRAIGYLVRAHLIEESGSRARRWRMHDLLHLYARQLSDSEAVADAREQAVDRLLSYYRSSAGAADAHMRARAGTRVPADFGDREDALEWLDAERPCLVAAVALAGSTDRDQVAVELSFSLGTYLSWRRRFDDWLTVITTSHDAAQRLGDRVNEAATLSNLGAALVRVRRFDEAITALQDAAAIYRETGDRHGEGMALNNLGEVLREVRRFEESITAQQDAAAIYRETGDRHGEGMALNNLGLALVEVRRFEESITAQQDAAAIYRETGDRHGEGMALNGLGEVLREVRRFEESITAQQDAAAIYRETGDRHGEGAALNGLGGALVEARRFEEAITAHEDAAAIYRETGDRHGEGAALNGLGEVLREVRRFEEAITTLVYAAAIYQETVPGRST